MSAILTVVILFTVGILIGESMAKSAFKRKLNKGGFVVVGGEIYLCKKVTLVDISEIDDDENKPE